MNAMLLLALLAASPAEVLDALDVPNGGVLVSESGSFATGLGGCTAWRLSDGDDAEQAWCSPTGQTAGATFVYELDSEWRLTTLVLSNASAQENLYPGCSASGVELFVATAGSDFKKVGAFALRPSERRSFPLPGVLARRVKLVVTGNHGNAELTELGEVDLLGTRTAPVAPVNFTGVYATSPGPLSLRQDGTAVYGCYDYGRGAVQLWGTVAGRVTQLAWYEESPDEESPNHGLVTLSLLPDRSVQGMIYQGGQVSAQWEGPAGGPAPTCTVRKDRALAQLIKKSGRAALYGIRFATGKDVPLPESTPALKELAAALKAEPTMRVAIEGHTDSVDRDELNLALSRRRASTVRDWLVKNGVAAKRLTAEGYGETRPVADNTTAQGRALNRRVEAALVP